jgi:hypothetical protein
VEQDKIYRVKWDVESSVSDPDQAVQFRLLAARTDTYESWSQIIQSNMNHAPSVGNPKSYNVFLKPAEINGAYCDLIFDFDILSFNWSDDATSWLYLDSVLVEEISLVP